MGRYADLLKRALSATPWEARSINGSHHDATDWLALRAGGFPLPITRLEADGGAAPEKEAERDGEDALGSDEAAPRAALPQGMAAVLPNLASQQSRAKGAWGVFELGSGKAVGQSRADANLATTRTHRIENRTSPAAKPAPSSGLDARELDAHGLDACEQDARGRGASASEGGEGGGVAALARLARQTHAAVSAQATADSAEGSACRGLQALRRLSELRRGVALDTAASVRHVSASNAAASRSAAERGARVSLVLVGDSFAARCLRGCLLASLASNVPFAGLQGIVRPAADARDVRYYALSALGACDMPSASSDAAPSVPSAPSTAASSASPAPSAPSVPTVSSASSVPPVPSVSPATPTAAPPASDDAERMQRWAEASLRALDPAAPSSPLPASEAEAVAAETDDISLPAPPGSGAERAVLIDGCNGVPALDAGALERTLRSALADCAEAVVLIDPAEASWTSLLGSALTSLPRDAVVRAFTVDADAARSEAGRRRFLRGWWAWFGSGSRWGLHELSAALRRTESLLGFDLHPRQNDLGLTSVLAAQLRDGGSIASADDLADAFADRFPDRTVLQATATAIMTSLLSDKTSTSDGRVFVNADLFAAEFARSLGELEGRPAAAVSSTAQAFGATPSLQVLMSLQKDAIEVRFSQLLACLAARWLLDDASLSALDIVARLQKLVVNVPLGGWGHIVQQTVLLAEQRGRSAVARAVLERLYQLNRGYRSWRAVLVEISLGVFLDTGGKMPAMWRHAFLETNVSLTQADIIATASSHAWLRPENRSILMRAATDCVRGGLASTEPASTGKVPALQQGEWVLDLLRLVDEPDFASLARKLAARMASDDADERRCALASFDNLSWACVMNARLPRHAHRADLLQPDLVDAACAETYRQVVDGGAALEEAASVLWFAATECPAAFAPRQWRAMADAAVDRLLAAFDESTARTRGLLYQVLAAVGLVQAAYDRDAACERFRRASDAVEPQAFSLVLLDLITWRVRGGRNLRPALQTALALYAMGALPKETAQNLAAAAPDSELGTTNVRIKQQFLANPVSREAPISAWGARRVKHSAPESVRAQRQARWQEAARRLLSRSDGAQRI